MLSSAERWISFATLAISLALLLVCNTNTCYTNNNNNNNNNINTCIFVSCSDTEKNTGTTTFSYWDLLKDTYSYVYKKYKLLGTEVRHCTFIEDPLPKLVDRLENNIIGQEVAKKEIINMFEKWSNQLEMRREIENEIAVAATSSSNVNSNSHEKFQCTSSSQAKKPYVLVLTGPTGSGKTETGETIFNSIFPPLIQNGRLQKSPHGVLYLKGEHYDTKHALKNKSQSDVVSLFEKTLVKFFQKCRPDQDDIYSPDSSNYEDEVEGGETIIFFDEIHRADIAVLNRLSEALSEDAIYTHIDYSLCNQQESSQGGGGEGTGSGSGSSSYCEPQITKYDTSKTIFIFTADAGEKVILQYFCKHGSIENLNDDQRRILQTRLKQEFSKKIANNTYAEDNISKFVDVIAAYQPLSPIQMEEILQRNILNQIELFKGLYWKWVDIDSALYKDLVDPKKGSSLYKHISKESCKEEYGKVESPNYKPEGGYVSALGARGLKDNLATALMLQISDPKRLCTKETKDYDKNNLIIKVEYLENKPVKFYRCKEYIYNEDNYDGVEFREEDKDRITILKGKDEKGKETKYFCKFIKKVALANIL